MSVIKWLSFGWLYILLGQSSVSAQKYQHRVGIGLDYIALDLPDDLVFSPHINYERKYKDRLFLSGKVGFVSFSDKDTFTQTIPESRKRVMLDIEAKLAVIRFKNNYFKIGVGPSIWYRNDDVVKNVKFPLNNQTNFIDYEKRRTREVNTGIKVNAEVDVKLLDKVSLIGGFSISQFKGAGTYSVLGITTLIKLY